MEMYASHSQTTRSCFPGRNTRPDLYGSHRFFRKKDGLLATLFPELAALSHDVFTRPHGKWASQPWRLVLTPTITALFGLFVVRHTNFNALALTLIVAVSLLVIKLLKSTIAPAISAGVLSMVLAVRSWIYPVGIFAGLSLLALVLLVWKRYIPKNYTLSSEEEIDSKVIDDLEALPHDRLWCAALVVFVLALATLAQVTGLFFLIFPPLIVVAYELIGHPEVPGWMAHPILFPLISFLTAAIGLGFCHIFDAGFVGVIVTMLCSMQS
jgi:hypothetical protein